MNFVTSDSVALNYRYHLSFKLRIEISSLKYHHIHGIHFLLAC